jgi:trk system potassium uptake protein TrkA
MVETLDVIVAGGGRVGTETARILDDRGYDVTVIEPDPDRADAVSDEYVATVITGDASDPTILEQAGVADADVVAGLTGQAGLNLAVCMEARQMGAGVRTVARIDRSEKEAYTRFVDAVLFPERAGARSAVNEIVGGDVETLTEITGDLEIAYVRVAEDAPAAGRTLSEVRFPAGTIVVSGEEGDRIARAETTLTPGRRYVVAVEPDVIDEVMRLMRG